MGLILGGLLAAALVIVLLCVCLLKFEMKESSATLIGILAFTLLIAGLISGIREPVSGYEEPQIFSTIELVSLRDENISKVTGNMFYVSVSGTNSYTYYVQVDSAYASNSQKAYKSKTISGSNVTIVEDDSYTEAKLVTYVSYGKKTFWTFAAGAKKYDYVFYVPTGTIVRDKSLG